MKRIKRILLLALFGILFITGCSKEKESGDYKIYYSDKDSTRLLEGRYSLIEKEPKKQIEEFVEVMSKNPEQLDRIKIIPDDVELKSVEIQEKTAYLNFNANYFSMPKNTEILCRAAMVLTMTQIEGIDSVAIQIEGSDLTDSGGKKIGIMLASDFADNSTDILDSYKNTTTILYYANKEGNALLSQSYNVVHSNDVSMENYVLEKLLDGPELGEGYATLSSSVKLLSVSTVDAVCYVDFSKEFLNQKTTVQNEIVIYSIVNTLCELYHVNKVQISVEGKIDVKYHDSISLNQVFVRNLDLVEK